MAFQSLRIQPGVNVEFTPALNEGGWSDCGFIRWTAGLPEKLGGWEKFVPYSYSSPVRALHAWQAGTHGFGQLESASQDWLAVGTEASLNAIFSSLSYPITPATRTQNVAVDFATVISTPTVTIVAAASALTSYSSVNIITPVAIGGLILYGLYPLASLISANSFTITAASNATATVVSPGGAVPTFTTVSGSAAVTVNLAAHGLAVGDEFDFQTSTAVGGVTISGVYTVVAIAANSYTIIANLAASSSTTVAMNSAQVRMTYYVVSPPVTAGVGWGGGAWGAGGWGVGLTPAFTVGTAITSTNWTLDNWGTTLIACQDNGPIFQWQPGSGFSEAQVITQAPLCNHGIFIAMPEQILVAYGSTVAGIHDPLLVRWSDVSDYTVWTASSVNQAGSFRIPKGNQLVGGLQANQRALLFTDQGIWSMEYISPPLVFGFNEIAAGCGLIGRHAAAVLFGITYWMSDLNFFVFDGQGVRTLPCSVWDEVFQDIDTTYVGRSIAAPNGAFYEMAFYYPSLSGGTHEVDSYAKYSIDDGVWDFGTLARTAWIDQGILGNPIGADSTGLIFQHENVPDADGAAMNAFITTGWFMLTEGDPTAFVDLILPDFKYGTVEAMPTAQMKITIYTTDWPGSTPVTHGPYSFTSTTKWINVRCRARMMRVRIESTDIGSFWRLGNLRYRGAVDGRRGD